MNPSSDSLSEDLDYLLSPRKISTQRAEKKKAQKETEHSSQEEIKHESQEQIEWETVQGEDAYPGYTVMNDLTIVPNSPDADPELQVKPNRLCKFCQNLVQKVNLFEEGWRSPFHGSMASWRVSLKQGCHICTLLFTLRSPTRELVFPCFGIMSVEYMTLQLVDSQGGGTHPLSLKAVYPPNLPDFSLTNASIATFEAARSSLHDCNSTHTSCKDRKPSEIWPTRLIDVGSAGNDCLRVVTLAQPQLYCATSHCWGNHANHLQLNRDTYTRLVSGFSFYELPRLYADFVIAARQLGVQYLWVDSLCIIQDNKDDWEYEARRMADVYQGSYCTLAATSAQNSDDSLFLKTSPLCNISYVPKGVQNWGLVYPRPGWFQNSTSATFPLHKRAWVFQETLLSPRQLHFGFGGVSFTCRQIGVEPSGEFFPPQIVQSWRDLLRTKNYKLTDVDRAKGQALWQTLVSEYSNRNLTFESDRLLALEGVVSALQQHTPLRVIAGVIVDFLPYSLIWHFKYTNLKDRRNMILQDIPSWSLTYCRGLGRTRLLEHHRSKVKAEIHTPCGDGKPRLCLQGKSFYAANFKTQFGNIYKSAQVGDHFDKLRAAGDDIGLGFYQPQSHEFLRLFELSINMDFSVQEPMRVEFVILIVEPVNPSEIYAKGIVLATVEDNSGEWERVGYFESSFNYLKDARRFRNKSHPTQVDIDEILESFSDTGEFVVQ